MSTYLEREDFLRFKQLVKDTGQTQSQAARDLILASLPPKPPKRAGP